MSYMAINIVCIPMACNAILSISSGMRICSLICMLYNAELFQQSEQ